MIGNRGEDPGLKTGKELNDFGVDNLVAHESGYERERNRPTYT